LQVDCANAGFGATVIATAARTISVRAIQRTLSASDTPNGRTNAAVFPNKII
jgi:hypothetical protein